MARRLVINAGDDIKPKPFNDHDTLHFQKVIKFFSWPTACGRIIVFPRKVK